MPLVTLDVDTLEEIVLGKCSSFVNMSIWPAGEKLSPNRWLNNFEDNEREHALHLLNSFTFYNLEMSVALLRGSLLSLSELVSPGNSISSHTSNWKEFLSKCIFVPVAGETRNVTDSGNIIAGYLRRELHINEARIINWEQLYDSSKGYFFKLFEHIVFFDDFVGSGAQFIGMWKNNFKKDAILLNSIESQCQKLGLLPHYCAMIGTSYGLTNIQTNCPSVDIHFAHTLQPSASPLHPKATAWPDHLKASGPAFIIEASKRAGIPDDKIAGFHNLGLSLAFSFTIPDATLPIFRWNQSGWSPLMERT